MVTRLEALADALIHFSRFKDPENEQYQSRNPGNLPATQPWHARNEQGRRIFKSMLDGYQALLFDLAAKCAGKNKHLHPDSPLRMLVTHYGQPSSAADFVARFLRRALHDQSIKPDTPLSFFIEAN